MRTLVVFGLVMAVLFLIGIAAAAAVVPPKDLFLPPPKDGTCERPSSVTTAEIPAGEVEPRAPAREV